MSEATQSVVLCYASPNAMVLFVTPPPNSYVETLMSNVVVLIGGAFGRFLTNEDGALMNGISALIKEDPESSLAPPLPPHEDAVRRRQL